MRISKLSLTNFKSFKETQTIEFAPVTLLLGPNSVGKSTVLMALFYVQQILSKGQCNPQYIEALGNKFIGGFKNLVHGKNLNDSITIRIEYTKVDDIGSEYTAIRDFMNEDETLCEQLEELELNLNSATEDSETVSIELEISWSEPKKDAYVSRYSVWLDDEPTITAISDSGMKQLKISEINFKHHVFLDDATAGKINYKSDVFKEGSPEFDAFKEAVDGFTDNFSEAEFPKSDLGFWSPFLNYLDSYEAGNRDFTQSNPNQYSIGFKGFSGALPLLKSSLESNYSHEDNNVTQLINELLSNALVSPLDNLLDLLDGSLCIGPLRHIPDSNYQVNPYPQQSDWYNGEACWDLLAQPDLIRDCKINSWMEDEDKLNLGYKLVYRVNEHEYRYVRPTMEIKDVETSLAVKDAIGESLQITISKEDLSINPDSHQDYLPESNVDDLLKEVRDSISYIATGKHKNTSLTLWDNRNAIEVTGSDVGVGVSQVLPLVVSSIVSTGGLIACEQPELHVHPRVQVAIGDLLTQANEKANFLIETHSEHLILRLLRRIRETNDGDLPEGMKALTPKEVSITYLEPSDEGVKSNRINIDDDGEFTSRWPNGFFSERSEELF